MDFENVKVAMHSRRNLFCGISSVIGVGMILISLIAPDGAKLFLIGFGGGLFLNMLLAYIIFTVVKENIQT